MADNYLLTEQSVKSIQTLMDDFYRSTQYTGNQSGAESGRQSNTAIRGYLCQGVSRGQKALCCVVSHRPEFQSFKIDLAGVIYTNHPDGESSFKLRCYRNDDSGTKITWFDTAVMTISDLTAANIIYELIQGSSGELQREAFIGALGHPFRATNLIDNDELYPSAPADYQIGDIIESKIGSWLISINRASLPEGFDMDLLFSVSDDESVNLAGPAVMTLYETADVPTGELAIVTDVMDVASPTPLRGGTKIAAVYFGDVGYGIIAANPREYLFEQKWEST